MSEKPAHESSNRRPAWVAGWRRTPRAIVLWRLRGARADLLGLAFETSYGYALGLELDTELVLLHLQPNLEALVAYANRIESTLTAQGWQVIEDSDAERERS